MNTLIEIHEDDTINSGYYRIWYKDKSGKQCTMKLDECHTNSLLNMRQKEDFFMGKYKFKINESDFIRAIINKEKNQAFNTKK